MLSHLYLQFFHSKKLQKQSCTIKTVISIIPRMNTKPLKLDQLTCQGKATNPCLKNCEYLIVENLMKNNPLVLRYVQIYRLLKLKMRKIAPLTEIIPCAETYKKLHCFHKPMQRVPVTPRCIKGKYLGWKEKGRNPKFWGSLKI